MKLDIVKLKLSAQRGLLGHVFHDLRTVSVNIVENIIRICFYIDGEITEEQTEFCEFVIDEIIADFCNVTYNGKEIEFEPLILRLDYPQKPTLDGFWVYYRYEDSSKYT